MTQMSGCVGKGVGQHGLVCLLWGLFLALMVAGGTPALADAGSPLRLTADTGSLRLGGHFTRLIEPDRRLSFADILKADAEGRFEPRTELRSAGQTRNIHWYRFDLLRDPGAPADWILELGEAFIDHLDLYVPVDPARPATGPGDFRVIRMGDFVPFSQRPMQTRLHATPLSLPEAVPVTVYLRIDSISALSPFGTLRTPGAFAERQTVVLLFQGAFFGVLAILVLGYAALGLTLKDGALLAYTAYVAMVFVYYLFANGVAAVLLPDSPGWLMNLMVGGSGLLSGSAAMLLWDRLLDLRRNFPRLHWLYMSVAVAGVLLLPSTVMPVYSVTNPVFVSSTSAMTPLSVVLILILMRRNPRDVGLRFYLATTLTVASGMFLMQLWLRGVLAADSMVVDPYQTASVLGVLILGAGLTLRIGRLQTERVRAEQETAFATTRAEEQRTFVVMLSHEFRTPLASIDGAVQMVALTGGVTDPACLKRLDRVRATTRKLADLVEMFLSSDALDQGALALRTEPTPLGSLLDQALGGLTAQDGETRVTVAVSAPQRPVRGDPQFLGVAVGNLVQNALRYSPPDTTVAVSAWEEPGGVAISVADQGHGMSPEEVARIGTIYFRADSSRGTKGAGIGLYMTQKIVAAHGGTLGVESVKGLGSIFTIRLRDDALPMPLPAQ